MLKSEDCWIPNKSGSEKSDTGSHWLYSEMMMYFWQ
jgi:hypothetical protein